MILQLLVLRFVIGGWKQSFWMDHRILVLPQLTVSNRIWHDNLWNSVTWLYDLPTNYR